jgi:hypothetical protein
MNVRFDPRFVSRQIAKQKELPKPQLSTQLENIMVARDGIEPPTRGFSVRCSTN